MDLESNYEIASTAYFITIVALQVTHLFIYYVKPS